MEPAPQPRRTRRPTQRSRNRDWHRRRRRHLSPTRRQRMRPCRGSVPRLAFPYLRPRSRPPRRRRRTPRARMPGYPAPLVVIDAGRVVVIGRGGVRPSASHRGGARRSRDRSRDRRRPPRAGATTVRVARRSCRRRRRRRPRRRRAHRRPPPTPRPQAHPHRRHPISTFLDGDSLATRAVLSAPSLAKLRQRKASGVGWDRKSDRKIRQRKASDRKSVAASPFCAQHGADRRVVPSDRESVAASPTLASPRCPPRWCARVGRHGARPGMPPCVMRYFIGCTDRRGALSRAPRCSSCMHVRSRRS